MLDLLIKGGTIVDGTGKPGYPGDIGVEGKAISAIGQIDDTIAARVIDGRGLVISPGFIDTHAHSDGALLVDGQHENGIRQGVTTEIIDPDGISYDN